MKSKKLLTAILAILLSVVMISCEKNEETSNSVISEYTADSAENSSETMESVISEPEVSEEHTKTGYDKIKAIAKIKAGEVRTTAEINQKVSDAVQPLAQWYYENVLNNEITYEISFVDSKRFSYFVDFAMDYAFYKISTENNGSTQIRGIAILCGVFYDKPNEYILIDGKDVNNTYYSIDSDLKLIKENAVFNEYTDNYSTSYCPTAELNIDIDSLIGDGRTVHDNIAVNETTIAVVSEKNGDDTKVDFIDITNGTLVCESHLLTAIDELEYSIEEIIRFNSSEDNHLILWQAVKNTSDGGRYNAWYDVFISDDGSVSDTLIFADTEDYEYNSAHSESGRYKTFYNNGDLFIHDNTSNVDTLVFDRKPDDESGTTDIGDYRGANLGFFEGETLYFPILGWEWVIGTGCYNPETKETVIYENSFYAYKYINGNLYGYENTGNYEGNLGYFNPQTPDSINVFAYSVSESSSFMIFSSNDKHVAVVSTEMYEHEISLDIDICSIKVYSTDFTEECETYTFNSQETYDKILIIGDYIYVPTYGDNNKAYTIKIK